MNLSTNELTKLEIILLLTLLNVQILLGASYHKLVKHLTDYGNNKKFEKLFCLYEYFELFVKGLASHFDFNLSDFSIS